MCLNVIQDSDMGNNNSTVGSLVVYVIHCMIIKTQPVYSVSPKKVNTHC